MYDIRQFRPVLYLVVLLGTCGYALAARSATAGILAGGAILLNAWLVQTGRFTPLPRPLASAVTLLCLAFVAWQAFAQEAPPILAIGQFLLLLQIVKLYEQRGNRDYGQLLVLSLLLMVAVLINTASLYSGLLLLAYLITALYCCLLFHLKVESEEAQKAFAVPAQKIAPLALRQNRRLLGRSMRRLTALAGTVSLLAAALLFVLFPRVGTAASPFSQQFAAAQTLTGFSDQVSFGQLARITQNTQIVAHVQVWKDRQEVTSGDEPLLLRGLTLDTYSEGAWSWSRSAAQDEEYSHVAVARSPVILAQLQGVKPLWKQRILLEPTGTSTLFAMAGPVAVTFGRDGPFVLRYSRSDQSLQTAQPLTEQVEYEVLSSNRLDQPRRRGQRWSPAFLYGLNAPEPGTASYIDPRIAAYARRPEVSGAGSNGPLAQLRGTAPVPNSLDEQIAGSVEAHLRDTFAYTLDLSDASRASDQDPLVAFVYDLKRGHCEYFAGAMTLMCQSLGLQARMVVGFKSDEFNSMLRQYVVRQSHAHAWVEVLTTDGWKTYDPTATRQYGSDAAGGRDAAAPIASRMGQLGMQLRHWLDYMEYQWRQSVVAYDAETRQGLVARARRYFGQAVAAGSWLVRSAHSWLAAQWWSLSSNLLAGMLGLMALVPVGAVGWFAVDRSRLRRRAQRIGIAALSDTQQVRLARQLGFYDEMMQLLERHHVRRPPHLTPMEFAESLVFLPNDGYHIVQRLTELFYRVRFGQAALKPSHQRRLAAVVRRLESSVRLHSQRLV